jgi:SpoIID/LytB domain protein
MRRPEAGPVLAAAALAVFLAVFTWSCQSLSKSGGSSGVRLSAEPDIRVRVRHRAEKVRLEGPRLVFVTEGGSNAVLLRTPVVVAPDVSGLVVTEAGGAVKTYMGAIEVSSGAPRKAGVEPTVAVDGTEYPGRLRVALTGSGDDPDDHAPGAPAPAAASMADAPALDVIASMGMEMYLPGVVAKELPGGWPEATNRVEAVCARSYALHQRERARAAGRLYDVESTTKDQAYLGSTSRPEAVAAVRATRGEAMVYSGPEGAALLRAYYSSTCGGRTASAMEVWPSGAGHEFNRAAPVQGRTREWACQKSPVYRWSVARGRVELEERLREWGRQSGSALSRVGPLASIRIAKVSPTGRPSRYAVEDATGRTFEMTAEELRVACNTVTPKWPAPERKTLVRSGDLEASFAGDAVTISGRGFGHGVGMCQYCAKGFADQGWDYRRMLVLFYPGAWVEKVY